MGGFKDARDALEGVRMADALLARDLERRCDWEDPEDASLYRAQERLRHRIRVLDRLAPERVCPACGETVLRSRSWVVRLDEGRAVCRSCYFRHARRPEETVTMAAWLVERVEYRYVIDPAVVREARERAGLSVSEMARRAGWSRAYQRKLECGHRQTLSGVSARTVLQVLREAGVTTRDVVEDGT